MHVHVLTIPHLCVCLSENGVLPISKLQGFIIMLAIKLKLVIRIPIYVPMISYELWSLRDNLIIYIYISYHHISSCPWHILTPFHIYIYKITSLLYRIPKLCFMFPPNPARGIGVAARVAFPQPPLLAHWPLAATVQSMLWDPSRLHLWEDRMGFHGKQHEPTIKCLIDIYDIIHIYI